MLVFYVGARDFKSALPCVFYIALRVKPFMHFSRDSSLGLEPVALLPSKVLSHFAKVHGGNLVKSHL